ncbi:hypothetical protein F5B21DRAFT_213664 [Xylaria acuta]|nr:hypothetical protein F5B21DRAFT_213664 [Xylaria acuta]
MSYWSTTNSGADGHSGSSYGPPPLPPRSDGRGPIGAPGAAVPPPIPPRPAGFGYQPLRDPGPLEPPNQSIGSSARIQRRPIIGTSTGAQAGNSPTQDGRTLLSGHDGYLQYPSSQPGVSLNQTQGYSDISHFFPDGKIPPPPPRPGVSPSPQPPLDTGKPDTGVSPAVLESQLPTNDGFQRTYSEGNQLQNQTQQSFPSQATSTFVSADPRKHTDITKDYTTDANIHDAGNNPAGEAGNTQEAIYVTVSDDIATMNKTFQSMELRNSSDAISESSEERNIMNYDAYSPQQSSNPAPAIPAKVPLPTQQTPGARSPTSDASTTPPRQPQTVVRECISTESTFATTWYTHPRAPEYPICMNCYENHIRGSRFKGEFQGTFLDDGKPRGCGFTCSRIKDSLWELALTSGSFDSLIEYMILRPSIPDCRGQGGAKAGSGIKWYRTRNNDIPAMAVCQACYEDHILAYPKFGQDHFEPFDASTIQQVADQMWSCDIAVSYIYREYKVRASTNDWPSFVQAVSVRLLSFQPCPGEKTVYPDGKGRKWFTPINGPYGLLICGPCYCDYILLTGQEPLWRDAGDNLVQPFGVSVSCFFGAQYNVKVLAGRVLETNDYALFWKGIDVAAREPRCKGRIQNATWYTLRSDPNGFEICRTCYVTLAESMGVGHHFKPKTDIPPGSSMMCSFNPGIARFLVYMNKFVEMVYKQDPAPLEEFVKEYAFMPQCHRDKYVENARWFGWKDCAICAECHYEFIRGTALADSMPSQGTQVKGAVMCEMYSPRMRQLYLAVCASDPPDPKPLLEYSAQRRAVWAQTMPRARQILSDIKVKALQQQSAMNTSLFYWSSGNLWQNTLPLEQTYSNSATGHGNYNHMQIKGAEYGQLATALGSEIRGSPAYVADELERRWRLVE